MDLETGRSWLRPKLAGSVGSACNRCLCEVAGRGFGSKMRDFEVEGCFVGCGGGDWGDLWSVEGSVDRERVAIVRRNELFC